MSESNTSSGGVGFTGLLTIAFVVLKLCKVIDWPWLWVVSPIWISIALVLFILCGTGVYYLIKYYRQKIIIENRNKERRAEIIDMQNRCNELSERLGVSQPKSKWEQRMDEMYNRKKSNNA